MKSLIPAIALSIALPSVAHAQQSSPTPDRSNTPRCEHDADPNMAGCQHASDQHSATDHGADYQGIDHQNMNHGNRNHGPMNPESSAPESETEPHSGHPMGG